MNLLLYSVFRIGDATNSVAWSSYLALREWPEIAWTVPLSLGDSHRGFPVLCTDHGYFEHYRHAGGQRLEFTAGGVFDDRFDAVLGAEVAHRLGYRLGDRLTLAHGAGRVSFVHHDKGNASALVPAAELDALAETCDAVVAAYGH